MAQPMMTFAARRGLAGFISAVLAGMAILIVATSSLALRSSAYLSGWMLLVMLLFLALYNLRKKLPYPPLLMASTWLQLHIYAGLLSVVVFLLHTGLRLPTGPFETALALVYWGVAVTGIIGLILSRVIPPRLTSRGEEVLFERIPMLRRQLRQRAEELVVQSVEQGNASTLAEFYQQRLADFFAHPRHRVQHLCQSARPLRELIGGLESLHRYLNDDERRIVQELTELIQAKDMLDYHHAMQGVLKMWLFLHIPLTYVLLMFVAVHVPLVHAFFGGVW